jgi:diguanylate cyclase (GGDEF)-like protein
MREHILCVDDEEGILTALQKQLSHRFGAECEIAVAKSAAEALELIDELERDGERLAVVIADQIMPGMKGAELLERIHAKDKSVVKILLTGQAGLDAVVYAINKAGLDHYLGKPWDEPGLRLTVEKLLQKHRIERENERLVEELRLANANLEDQVHDRTRQLELANAMLEEANGKLQTQAVTDGLTGVFNHRYFQQQLKLEFERVARSGQPLSLLMIDVDHFKRFNDRHGHLAGDEVLRQLARILGEGRRANDVVARYGGEEFAVLLAGTDRAKAAEVAEQIRERIALLPVDGADERLTVSIGVASAPLDAQSAIELVSVADAALYTAKRAGRDRVVVAGAVAA